MSALYYDFVYTRASDANFNINGNHQKWYYVKAFVWSHAIQGPPVAPFTNMV